MSHQLVERILSGQVPDAARRAAAKGSLPIPREDLIELWVGLRNDKDPEVRISSKESLASIQESEWRELLPNYPFRPEVIEFAMLVLGRNKVILESALRNKEAPLDAVEKVAGQSEGGILDMILDNQTRLLKAPGIVVAMLNNPAVNISQVRRIFDIAEQFFKENTQITTLLQSKFNLRLGAAGGAVRRAEPVPEAPKAAPALDSAQAEEEVAEEAAGELEEVAPEAIEEGEVIPEAFEDGPLDQEKTETLFKQVLKMNVPKKIELALKGNKEARGLLIRDSNKIVQLAVISSPKITEEEIETISKLRNMPEDIFRKIALNKNFVKKYTIVKALTFNPKTPQAVAINFIKRLNDSDLKFLVKDKGVSELIRREAKKAIELKTKKH